MSDARKCPLGEDCDLTIAWMAGRADADRALAAERDTLKARAEAVEAKVARLRDINARLCDWIEHEAGCDLPFDARAALQEPRP